MLTADLARTRRRGRELRLVPLERDERSTLVALGERLLRTVREHVGRTREELRGALGELPVAQRERKLFDGLAKLVEDASDWSSDAPMEVDELRSEVFLEASGRRASGAPFDRGSVLGAVAARLGIDVEAAERNLYADLRGAQVLRRVEELDGERLVERWERGQAQAVLLKAARVVVDVRCAAPPAYRELFRKLKFRQLLHEIQPLPEGYRITIDGPLSLFDSVTKYGLQLALILPALEECESFTLEADVRWGKQRTPLTFRHEHSQPRRDGACPVPDDVATLLAAVKGLGSRWTASVASTLLHLEGLGVCVPDLVLQAEGERPVYVELLGYWSRDAVWRRVDLAEAGLGERLLFAVSQRLRVSEEVLDDVESAALYVYKGTISPRTLVERAERLCEKPYSARPRRR